MSDQCATCRYDLSGLGVQGKCPECGTYFNRRSGENIHGGASYSRRQSEMDRKLTWAKAITLTVLGVAAAGGGLAATVLAGGRNDRWLYLGLMAGGFLLLWALTAYADLRTNQRR